MRDDSGSAFPTFTDGGGLVHEGLTIRDYMAIHLPFDPEDADRCAIKLMGYPPPDMNLDPVGRATYWYTVEARLRFLKADAMLLAKGK